MVGQPKEQPRRARIFTLVFAFTTTHVRRCVCLPVIPPDSTSARRADQP